MRVREPASIAGIAGAIIGTVSMVADFDQTFSWRLMSATGH
jgi:hypothetical protein